MLCRYPVILLMISDSVHVFSSVVRLVDLIYNISYYTIHVISYNIHTVKYLASSTDYLSSCLSLCRSLYSNYHHNNQPILSHTGCVCIISYGCHTVFNACSIGAGIHTMCMSYVTLTVHITNTVSPYVIPLITCISLRLLEGSICIRILFNIYIYEI